MKVVFLEEVEGTARVGEVKNVADGFARNYLLPRKLAAPATDHYINIAQARAEKDARRQDRLDDEARQYLVPKLQGKAITIEVRVGEQGKLFGSVTARDIAEALHAASGIELEHRQVDLREPIRETGPREVSVKLTRNVHVPVTVNVEPLGGLPEPEESLITETSAGAEAQDADQRRQAEEGSQDTSARTSVGVEALAEAAQVAAPQEVAEVAAPDQDELEHTGEVD